MNVFLSWSGDRSHKVAKFLDTWIQCVIQAVDPWLSSRDIDRGSLWFTEINSQLADTHNGIICLTKENIDNPWILFESGALAKGLSSNRVFTFLVDLEPKDVRDPLAQFNHTLPEEESMYALVRSINKGLEKGQLSDDILRSVFETYWPKFQKDFQEILESTPNEELPQERSKDDMLSEILYAVRNVDKRLRKVENAEPYPFSRKESQEFVEHYFKEAVENLVKGVPEEEVYFKYKEIVPLVKLKEAFRNYNSKNKNSIPPPPPKQVTL